MQKRDVVEATGMSLLRVAEVTRCYHRIAADRDKKCRKAANLCVACFYLPHVGGTTVTRSTCLLCGKPIMNASTDTDRLCQECAARHSLCCRCGADRELREGRRKFDFESRNSK